MRTCSLALTLAIAACAAPLKDTNTPLTPNELLLRDFEALCEADDGALWGVSLCGPLLIVDRDTREVWASDADGFGALSLEDGAWVGQLPPGIPIANTAMSWSGRDWVMVMSPLSGAQEDRQVLVMHEAWHRIQSKIGLAAAPSNATDLDAPDARLLMRLEIQALLAALRDSDEINLLAVQDALRFRNERHRLFPNLEAEEAALDRNEGLASYTGAVLGADNPILNAIASLDSYADHDAYSRSYAYATGPAYGLILDAHLEDWRSILELSAPADLLSNSLNIDADPADWRNRAEYYGLAKIEAQETARAIAQQEKVDALRADYLRSPRLVLPLRNMQIGFDPNGIISVGDLGTLYTSLTLSDEWGELTAPDGAIISPDFRTVILANPNADGLSGETWSIELGDQFLIRQNVNSADFELVNLENDQIQ